VQRGAYSPRRSIWPDVHESPLGALPSFTQCIL